MFDVTMAQYEKGHKITVITRSAENDAQFDAKLPFSVIRIPVTRISSFAWKAYHVIKSLPIRPDIVHSHGPAASVYLMLRGLNSPPLVHTMHAVRRYQFYLLRDLHNSVKAFEERNAFRVLNKPSNYNFLSYHVRKELFLEKYICRLTDHIAVVAEYFAKQIEEYYKVSCDKITTIYNGSRFELSTGLTSNEHGIECLSVTAPIILYIGRVDWVKRVHLLVEAMPSILKNFPQARLLIVGTGDQKTVLTHIVNKLNLTKSVKLLGWLPHENLSQLLHGAACFCLPSYWEGLSKALLEAMSCRVPVIATNNIANRELLREGKLGWLVKEATPEKWCEKIRFVLASGKQVLEKVNSGSELLDNMYRWHHVAERLDAAYEKVLKSQASR